MDINQFAREVHENAVKHGWWDDNPSFERILLMCHSEISEAVDEYRRGMPMMYVLQGFDDGTKHMETDMTRWTPEDKPEGVAVEMGDCLIRILDWFAAQGLDVEAILTAKHAYNKGRSYRHGGKLL